MGRFQIRKIGKDGQQILSAEFDSRDAAQAFARIENDKACTDAEVWENGKRVACAHRQGSRRAPFWILDQQARENQSD